MDQRNCFRVLLGLGALGLAFCLQPDAFAQAPDSSTQGVAQTADKPTPPAPIPSSAVPKKKSDNGDRGIVTFSGYSPGTVVIKTRERRLYYVVESGKAVRYTVGVGRRDKQWTGHAMISGKYIKPAWSPPDEIRRDNPRLPWVIPGGASNNPMGAAAITLSGGEYAIHGTNRPGSVGGFVSYGCFRMLNSDVLDLYKRVAVGTPVIVER
jgi:lipoprotein-anchoring transpeptidase ErfK/SrfK